MACSPFPAIIGGALTLLPPSHSPTAIYLPATGDYAPAGLTRRSPSEPCRCIVTGGGEIYRCRAVRRGEKSQRTADNRRERRASHGGNEAIDRALVPAQQRAAG